MEKRKKKKKKKSDGCQLPKKVPGKWKTGGKRCQQFDTSRIPARQIFLFFFPFLPLSLTRGRILLSMATLALLLLLLLLSSHYSLPPSLSIVIYFQSLSHSLSLNIFQIVCLDDSLRATESEWRPLCLSVSPLIYLHCCDGSFRALRWRWRLSFCSSSFCGNLPSSARLCCCCRWRLITEQQASKQRQAGLLFASPSFPAAAALSLFHPGTCKTERENSVLNRN